MTRIFKIIGLVLMLTVSTGNIAFAGENGTSKTTKKKAKATAAKKTDVKDASFLTGKIMKWYEPLEKAVPNAPFDEKEFTGATIAARKLAHIKNRRAAQKAYDDCLHKVHQDDSVDTTEELVLTIKEICPDAPPERDFFPLEEIDVSCEMGVDCGEEFEVTKHDLANFKAYFARKAKAVAKAKKRGYHMDVVNAFAEEEAKQPQRLMEFRISRCLEKWEARKASSIWHSSL